MTYITRLAVMLNQNTELYSSCVGSFLFISAAVKPLSCMQVAILEYIRSTATLP